MPVITLWNSDGDSNKLTFENNSILCVDQSGTVSGRIYKRLISTCNLETYKFLFLCINLLQFKFFRDWNNYYRNMWYILFWRFLLMWINWCFLKGSGFSDQFFTTFCGPCALCQMYREMKEIGMLKDRGWFEGLIQCPNDKVCTCWM